MPGQAMPVGKKNNVSAKSSKANKDKLTGLNRHKFDGTLTDFAGQLRCDTGELSANRPLYILIEPGQYQAKKSKYPRLQVIETLDTNNQTMATMTLNFSQEMPDGTPTHFVEKILDGRKKHSLRRDENRLWKKGRFIHMTTEARTKKRKQFNGDTCRGVQEVQLSLITNGQVVDGLSVAVDGKDLPYCGVIELATNDGFDSVSSFIRWFKPALDAAPDRTITYRLIHWTDGLHY